MNFRRILLIFLLLALICCVCIVAYAHSLLTSSKEISNTFVLGQMVNNQGNNISPGNNTENLSGSVPDGVADVSGQYALPDLSAFSQNISDNINEYSQSISDSTEDSTEEVTLNE